MSKIDPQIKEKLREIAPNLLEEKDLPMFFELQDINESLKKIAEKEMPMMPETKMPEVQKMEVMGAEVITIKGEKGDTPKVGIDFEQPKDGEDYVLTEQDKKDIASKIKVPIVEKVIEKTETIRELPIVTNEIKEVAKYETGEQIKEKILSIGLTIEDIEDLKKTLDDMKKGIERRPIFGGGGFSKMALDMHFVDDETPTNTGDDLNFTISHIPSPTSSLKVYLNGQRLKIGALKDYTFTGQTITLNSALLANDILTVDYKI
jgi:hypothetical protein